MLRDFTLFLFDFDGLLVDTEPLHFAAYKDALASRGFSLDWDVSTFCHYAHKDAVSLRKALVQRFPSLDADWPAFYEEKKKAYLSVLDRGAPPLLPGAEELLFSLEKQGKKRCVVTNSPKEQILRIRSHSPALQTIPHWFTREDYEHPKPHPDGYQKAIASLAEEGDRIIGFEDSMRGIEALLHTDALPVWVAPHPHPLLSTFEKRGVIGIRSLKERFYS